jgi:hypothetical protein
MSTSTTGDTRAALAARHPECATWLALYDEARAAVDDPAWAACVPAPSDAPPFIDGVTFSVPPRVVTRLMRALLRRAGTPMPSDDDARALFGAALAEDTAAVAAVAERAGIASAVAATAASLATMPLLQACRSAWAARISEASVDAACPVCGAWAAVVEARGLERRLRHRCGRWGADWTAQPVRCAFCDTRDHARLMTLVSERAGERGRVEACTLCRGYLKAVTMLTASPPEDILLLDLETVHLDVAAIEHGFERPAPKPRRVTLEAAPQRTRGRLAALLGGRG